MRSSVLEFVIGRLEVALTGIRERKVWLVVENVDDSLFQFALLTRIVPTVAQTRIVKFEKAQTIQIGRGELRSYGAIST